MTDEIDELAATTVPADSQGWHAALAKGEEIVWKCDHYHLTRNVNRPLPTNHPTDTYAKHPHLRSAKSCARIELQNRTAGKETSE